MFGVSDKPRLVASARAGSPCDEASLTPVVTLLLTTAAHAQRGDGRPGSAKNTVARGRRPAAQVRRPTGAASRESVGLRPLSRMTAEDRYQGEDGGLYGAEKNVPPDEHRRTAEAVSARVQPLVREGRPDPNGRVVFISISMSSATQEFSRCKQIADGDPAKSSKLKIVDCAQGGQAMAERAVLDSPAWRETDRRLEAAGVLPKQVQVAWIKLANKAPTGPLAEHGRQLQRDTQAVVQNAKDRFPSLRIAHPTSRIYAGCATSNLNPEPCACESACVVRWLIHDQITGTDRWANGRCGSLREPTADRGAISDNGPVKSPLLLWKPYLWADGTTPRAADKRTSTRDDLE